MLIKLFIKDLKVLIADRKNMLIFILMPIVLMTILSFSLKSSFQVGGKINPIKIAIVKEYDINSDMELFKGKISPYVDDFSMDIDIEEMFFDKFLNSEEVSKLIDAKVMTSDEAELAMSEKKVVAVLYLPDKFIYNQMINFTMPYRNEININLVVHGDARYSGQIVESIIGGYFGYLNERIVQKNVFIELGVNYISLEDVMKHLEEILVYDEEIEVKGISRGVIQGERPVDSATYYAIAMMSMFILYGASHTGRELLSEKKMLTLDRASVSGVGYGMVLAGKYIMTFCLCVLQMSVMLVYSYFVLKVQWDNLPLIIIGVLASSVAISGIGVFISALTLTQESYKVANLFEAVLIYVFALLGGSFIPTEVLPQGFARMKIFAVNGAVLDLFLGIYKGMQFNLIRNFILALMITSVVFTALGIIMVKKKEGERFA